MARITTTGFYLLLIVLSISCSKEKDDPTEIININDDLRVIMLEELKEGENYFTFTVETITDQNCQNYQIDYSLVKNSSQINLSINQLSLPEDCQPGNAPARQSIRVGELSPQDYDLQINLNNNEIINPGRLLVSYSQYNINLDSDHGIILPDKLLNRMPADAIWGYIGFHELSQEFDIQSSFENSIDDLVEPHNYPSGYYGHFRISELNELTIDADQEYSGQYNFLYRFRGEEEDLMPILEDLRAQYGNQIEIKLFTSSGSIL